MSSPYDNMPPSPAASHTPSSSSITPVDTAVPEPPLTVKTVLRLACRWLMSPLNAFIALLGLTVVVSGAILFMALVGMIQLPSEAEKERWIEINSQILNGIFSFAAFITTPMRIQNTYLYFTNKRSPTLLGRFPWAPVVDPVFLTRVVFLQLANSLAQYPISVAMWNWTDPKTRPQALIFVFLPIAFLTGTFAGVFEGKAKSLASKTRLPQARELVVAP